MKPAAKYPGRPILLIDDEALLLRSFESSLRNAGIDNLMTCSDSREASSILSGTEMELIVLDLMMPHVSGMEVLAIAAGTQPQTPVLVVTALNDVQTAVECMKLGAFDYMVKPIDKHRLVTSVRRAIETRELRIENLELKEYFHGRELADPTAFRSFLGRDEALVSIFKYVEAIARSPEPVLITGETGVGKELIAKAIHEISGKEGKFVAVNVAGLDDTMFSDTLFGHVKGAYTGAEGSRNGLIERAIGGTLLLDEIGDLSVASQTKLLRLIQEGEYLPLGSDTPKTSSARILVTTNKDIRLLLVSQKFREDLYYRLLSHHVRLPPLRERLGDLPILVDHFLDEACAALGKSKPAVPKELILRLSSYSFPGNVRELRGMIHDAVATHEDGPLSLAVFHAQIDEKSVTSTNEHVAKGKPTDGDALVFPTKLPAMDEVKRDLVMEALTRTSGNQGDAAKLLGVSRQTINRYCQQRSSPGSQA